MSGAVGLDFLQDGRCFALADFDHDGRLEIFLKNRNAPQLRVLKNVMKDLPPSIAFRLRGTRSNRDAIGAVVTVKAEAMRQTRTLQAGSGFLSQHSKEVFFGLGDAKGPVRATIRWPSGLVQELRDLNVNQRVWVDEGVAPSRIEPFKTPPQRLKPKSSVAVDGKAEARPFPASPAGGDKTGQDSEILPETVETWLLAPVTAPDFSLPDQAGQPRSISQFRGKPLLLVFWTPKIASSEKELAAFERIHSVGKPQGLQMIAVNVRETGDEGEMPDIPSLARKLHLSFPILRCTDDIAAIYNILYRYLFDRHRDLTLPTTFLIDSKGDIVKVYRGPMNPDQVAEDVRHIPETAAARIAKALPFPGITDVAEFPRNYLSYGSVFFQRGYFDQAEALFRLALRDNPSSAEALYGLGSACLKQGKNGEARDSFEHAIKLTASYPDTLPNAWNNLGLLATRDGRTDEAVQYFQEALKLSPDHLVALDNLGNAYRQQKRWDDARAILQHAVEVSPEDPEANYSLGMVFAQLNDTERAYTYLQQALKYRPGYPEALNNLGVLYLRTQRRDEAVANFEECIRVAPPFDQSYLNLARVYALEGQPEKARAVLFDLLKQHPGHPEALGLLEQLPK